MDFMNAVKETILEEYNTSVTENGALGYATTGKELLDLNFAVASLRNASENEIIERFKKAFYENKRLAIKWVFFARDVRGGLGERRLFRVIMRFLSEETPDAVIKLIPLFAEYGRWDDLIEMLKTVMCGDVRNSIIEYIGTQLYMDAQNATHNKPITLLAKWMPSENASSAKTKVCARYLMKKLNISAKDYRSILSSLRKYIDVVERKMSANKWNEINYESVPSKANLNYKDAFIKHDEQRRKEYLEKLAKGEAKINSSVLFPHEIVKRYREMCGTKSYYDPHIKKLDSTLEEMWKALPNTVKGNDNTIVVADGSGSMQCNIGGNTQALDVANALAIYFAEHSSGVFKDKYITFSNHPKFVDLSYGQTLKDKLNIAYGNDECANTNIEAVFNLILTTALKNNLKQEELPKNILIISDMEFDSATYGYNYAQEKLFTTIAKNYEQCGYKLPRLVFWNVISRTNTIPVRENENGVALVSGFSTNICQMVMSNETDPFKCLLNMLNSKRYDAVDGALKDIDI